MTISEFEKFTLKKRKNVDKSRVLRLAEVAFKEKDKKDIYDTGSFGKLLPPSSNFVAIKTSVSPAKALFLSPSVLIFTIISVLVCLAQFF